MTHYNNKLMKPVFLAIIRSISLRACHFKRENSHGVMKGIAKKWQCSIGWFFGLKQHCMINDRGKILDFVLTPGNVYDRKPLTGTNLLSRIFGKLFGAKECISTNLL